MRVRCNGCGVAIIDKLGRHRTEGYHCVKTGYLLKVKEHPLDLCDRCYKTRDKNIKRLIKYRRVIMEDLRCVSLHFYFKVLDSDMFGGEGTVGFTSCSANHCDGGSKGIEYAVSLEGFNKTRDCYRDFMAEQLNVSKDKLVPISYKEYMENTEEDEE